VIFRLAILAASLVLVPAVVPQQQTQRDATLRPTSGTASLTGVVVNDEEPARPVRRAIVTLAGEGLRPTRGAITDDAGRFTFVDLPAGQFTITVSRGSFVTSMYGAKRPGRPGTPISVADGAAIADVVVKIWRGAAVAGTLRDDTGAPVAGIEVRAVAARSPGGLPSLTNNGALTDEQGQFRIFGLEPGTYVVMARPSSGGLAANLSMTDVETDAAFEALKRRTSGQLIPSAPSPVPPPAQRPFDYAPIYFPGTPVLAQAATMSLAAGQDRGGLDFALQRVTSTLIEGTVRRPDGTPAAGAMLQLTMNNQPGPFGGVAKLELGAIAALDGTFRIAQVMPGDYDLVARAPVDVRAPGVRPGYLEPPSTAQLYAVAELSATGADIVGLALSLSPGIPIRGRIVFQSEKLPPSDLSGRVQLSLIPESYLPLSPSRNPVYSLRLPPSASIAADGTFEFTGVPPGRYQLKAATPDPEVWQLRSAMMGEEDVLDGLLEVPSVTPPSIVITYDDQRTKLSGRLESTAGAPASDVFVLAFSVDRGAWGPYTRRVKAVRPGSDGSFVVTGLPVGDYFLAVVTDADPEDWQSPAFLEQVLPAAVKVTLTGRRPIIQNLQIRR
jgi:hypothetical protein